MTDQELRKADGVLPKTVQEKLDWIIRGRPCAAFGCEACPIAINGKCIGQHHNIEGAVAKLLRDRLAAAEKRATDATEYVNEQLNIRDQRIASLQADRDRLRGLLQEAGSVARTHAMQTYSKTSADLANRIDAALAATPDTGREREGR